jgi:hypothetical protein
MSSAPELVSINGQWHVIHNGRSLENHARRDLADAALAKHTARLAGEAAVAKAKAPAVVESGAGGGVVVESGVPSVDLSVLDLKVPLLIERLATGDLDAMVPALIAAEEAKDKPRKSAIRVLQARLG